MVQYRLLNLVNDLQFCFQPPDLFNISFPTSIVSPEQYQQNQLQSLPSSSSSAQRKLNDYGNKLRHDDRLQIFSIRRALALFEQRIGSILQLVSRLTSRVSMLQEKPTGYQMDFASMPPPQDKAAPPITPTKPTATSNIKSPHPTPIRNRQTSEQRKPGPRQTTILNAPSNACAYLVVYDLFRNPRISQSITMVKEFFTNFPQLTELLCKGTTDFTRLRTQIGMPASCFNANDLTEDPWLILDKISKILANTNIRNSILPSQEQSKQDNLTFHLKGGHFRNDSEIPDLPFLFVRLLQGQRVLLNKPRIPRLQNYHVDTVIQFQPQDKHFRVIKFFGATKTVILDSDSSIQLNILEDRNNATQDPG